MPCVGCFEKHHDENAQTETNEHGKTDDEDVFHDRSLRFDTVLFLRKRGPQRRERIRDVNHNFPARVQRSPPMSSRTRTIEPQVMERRRPPSAQARLYGFFPKIDAGAKRDARSLDSKTECASASAAVVASSELWAVFGVWIGYEGTQHLRLLRAGPSGQEPAAEG